MAELDTAYVREIASQHSDTVPALVLQHCAQEIDMLRDELKVYVAALKKILVDAPTEEPIWDNHGENFSDAQMLGHDTAHYYFAGIAREALNG